MTQKIDIILASGSPRRRELLEREGVPFTVRVSEVDETLESDILRDPHEAAKKLAERKVAFTASPPTRRRPGVSSASFRAACTRSSRAFRCG